MSFPYTIYLIMATSLIVMLVLGLLGIAGSAITGGLTAAANKKSVEDTNQTNINLTRETNAANVEQANLAYQRSLPINQIKNLVDAGMSKQGAIQALTGGGTYTAPALQTASADAPMMDMSGVASAFERLGQMPSNVEQYQLIEQQRNALAVDTQNKIDANRRAEEMHDFNMWKQGYDKNTALMLDSASSKVANALLDSGKTIQDFKDFETMLRELGLSNDKDIRNITHVARQQLEDGVRSKFDTERARQSQENANIEQINRNVEQSNRNRAATDKHVIDMQQIKQMREDYQNSVKEHKTQDSERIAREMRSMLDAELANQGIAKAEFDVFLESLVKDEDGIYHKDEIRKGIDMMPKVFDKIWDTLFSIIPLNALSHTLLKDLLK